MTELYSDCEYELFKKNLKLGIKTRKENNTRAHIHKQYNTSKL